MFEINFEGEYNTRISEIKLSKGSIITPSYIPSITSLNDPGYLDKLNLTLNLVFPGRCFMISAYDTYKHVYAEETLLNKLIKFNKNTTIYLDSGGYELQGELDPDWDAEKLGSLCKELSVRLIVAFDKIPGPHQATFEVLQEIKKNLENTKNNVGKDTLVTLPLHAQHPIEVDRLAEFAIEYSEYYDIVAIPDRGVGVDILSRMKFVRSLRDSMEKEDIYKPIQIFGCSDPVSIILYIATGADIFDGIGWYNSLYPQSLLERADYSHLVLMSCDCEVCKDVTDSEITPSSYFMRLAQHNLLEIQRRFNFINRSIIEEKFEKIITDAKLSKKVQKILSGA
jgi:tRNA-guanine family transglycosylase